AEAIDQVARHGRGEAGPAHQDMDACCVLGQKDCRLAGGVASADEGNFRLLAHLRFESRSPVPHATAFEFGKARHVRTAVACPAGPAPTTATSNSSSCAAISSMPRHRPRASSEGSSSTEPLGHTASTAPSGAPYCSSMAAPASSVLGSTT